MTTTAPPPETALPEGAAGLIAVARVAHRKHDRELEQAALDRLARDFGIAVTFPCCESVDRDLAAVARPRRQSRRTPK